MRIARPLLSVALLMLAVRPAGAQRVGIHAEGGVVQLHGSRAAAAGFHVFSPVGRTGATRLDVGAAGDAYSVALDAGLDYRVPAAAQWTLVLRGGGGFMVEGPDWAGVFLRLGGGVAWRYSPQAVITVIVEGATHGGFAGPNRVLLGWERRFGRSRSSPWRR
jgi:hypothetical protein